MCLTSLWCRKKQDGSVVWRQLDNLFCVRPVLCSSSKWKKLPLVSFVIYRIYSGLFSKWHSEMSCQLGVGWGFGSGVQRSPGQLWKDRAGFVKFHGGCVVGWSGQICLVLWRCKQTQKYFCRECLKWRLEQNHISPFILKNLFSESKAVWFLNEWLKSSIKAQSTKFYNPGQQQCEVHSTVLQSPPVTLGMSCNP